MAIRAVCIAMLFASVTTGARVRARKVQWMDEKYWAEMATRTACMYVGGSGQHLLLRYVGMYTTTYMSLNTH